MGVTSLGEVHITKKGSFRIKPSSDSKDVIYLIFANMKAKAIFLASIVDLIATFYFPNDQETKLSPKKMQYAPIFLLSSLPQAQSASKHPISTREEEEKK